MITKISFLLIIISAFIHPLWNMLLKRSKDKIIFYLNIHLAYTLLFSFTLFIYPIKDITVSGWAFVILSAFAHFLYQIFLCRTYDLGDMSLAYPVARCSPLFVLLMGAVFLKEMPSKTAILGIIVLLFGVQLINHEKLSFSEFAAPFRHYNRKVMAAAGLTALFSACYAVIDKKAILAIEPLLFFYLFFSLSGFLFLGYFLLLEGKRKHYFQVLNRDKFRIILAAVLEASSYILILFAFRISQVSYIVALRQVSVVFGALYGIWFLKEKCGRVRIAGSLAIFAGIFLITMFG